MLGVLVAVLVQGSFSDDTLRYPQQALEMLWDLSVQENRERVACLGVEDNHIILEILPVNEAADSLRVPQVDCAFPPWVGTVHTHITLYYGQPYSTFSQSDREVMAIWRRRWGVEGVFCVVWSPAEIYCEPGKDFRYSTRTPSQLQVGRYVFQ